MVDRATGEAFEPSLGGGTGPRGVLSCGDDLITDHAPLAAMAADGVIAPRRRVRERSRAVSFGASRL